MVILIIVGGLLALFALLDLAEYLLARAGKRTLLYRRASQNRYFEDHRTQGIGGGTLMDRRPAEGRAQTSICMQNGP
jgi:hypothetical protein